MVCCVYELFGIISRMMSATSKFIYCDLFNQKKTNSRRPVIKDDATDQNTLPTFVDATEEQRGIYISIRK